MADIDTKDPLFEGFECKHVSYTKANDHSSHDMLLIKEVARYSDGRAIPHLRRVFDYKRPFWITKAFFQNHKDKKEWEDQSKLDRFDCKQVDLPDAITRALGRIPTGNSRLRMVCRSPFVYGADITPQVLAKQHYKDKWPEINDVRSTPYTVCNLDTEADVANGTEDIILLSLAMGKKVHLFVSNDFVKGHIHPEEQIRAAFDKYLGEYKAKRSIELEITFHKHEGEIAYEALKMLHAWKPDWVAIWNMLYDIEKMEKALTKYGYDLAEVWSDPSVPKVFQHYRLRKGSNQKVTQSGKTMPKPPYDQWHFLEAPASFQVLDAMCLYRNLRIARGLEPSYSLDSVLERNLGIRKLKFKEADHLVAGSLQWHQFLQRRYPIEYCVYNCFDTISMQELDDLTGDLALQVGFHAGSSDVAYFSSQPRRTWDKLHFECLNRGKVAATTSDTMRTADDDRVVSLRHWIATLPSHLMDHVGMKVVDELPDTTTMAFSFVADLDISSTYPTEQEVLNISRETTVREIIGIQGLDEWTKRSVGVNLTGGYVNATEICTKLFKAPSFDTLLKEYLTAKGQTVAEEVSEAWSSGEDEPLNEESTAEDGAE